MLFKTKSGLKLSDGSQWVLKFDKGVRAGEDGCVLPTLVIYHGIVEKKFADNVS